MTQREELLLFVVTVQKKAFKMGKDITERKGIGASRKVSRWGGWKGIIRNLLDI